MFLTDKARKYLSEFVGETPLHGFALAMGSQKGKKDLICWLPILLFCVVMAVYQTGMLIQLYQTVPTQINVVWQTDKPFVLDNLVLSLSHQVLNYYVTKSLNNITDLSSQLAKVDLKSLKSVNEGQKPNLSNSLILHLMQMFAKLSAAEKYGVKEASNVYSTFVNKSSGITVKLFAYKWDQRDHQIHQFLLRNNISLVAMLKSTAALVCDKMRIRIRNDSSVNYIDLANEIAKKLSSGSFIDGDPYKYDFPDIIKCDPSMIVYFDESKFSIRLISPSNPVIFNEGNDNFQLRFYPSLKGVVELYNSAEVFHLLLDEKVTYDGELREGNNMIGARMLNRIISSVRVRTAFQFYNTHRSPCSATEKKSDCFQRCVGNRYVTNCNCWPIHKFLWQPNNVSICKENIVLTNSTELMTSTAANMNECPNLTNDDTNYCYDQCSSECQRLDLEAIRSDQSKPQLFFEDTADPCAYNPDMCDGFLQSDYTSVQLATEMFSYLLIQEIPMKDWQSFLNEFGGLVGVWLGGSLIAFVHIPIFIVNHLFPSSKKEKPKVNAKMSGNDHSNTASVYVVEANPIGSVVKPV